MKTFSPLPKLVFDDTIALDTTDYMFDMHTYPTNASVFFFFFIRKLSTTRLFLRLEDINAFRLEALKSRVLPQRTSRRKLIGFTISNELIMPFAFPRGTQTANATVAISDQHILDRVLPLLSTIIQLLFVWVIGPIYGSFCAVME